MKCINHYLCFILCLAAIRYNRAWKLQFNILVWIQEFCILVYITPFLVSHWWVCILRQLTTSWNIPLLALFTKCFFFGDSERNCISCINYFINLIPRIKLFLVIKLEHWLMSYLLSFSSIFRLSIWSNS